MIVFGIIIIFIGFVYDVLFAGIPYQDPTPALAVSFAFHSQIASIIRWGGASIVITGGVTIIFLRLTKQDRKHKT